MQSDQAGLGGTWFTNNPRKNCAQDPTRISVILFLNKLSKNCKKRNIPVIVHIILGLPGESTKEVLETIKYLNALDIQGIKLQLLHILKDTDLAKELPTLSLLSEEEYIALLLQCIAHLSPDIVIHRLTGDGPKELLLAPLWSLHKRHVLNRIAHQLKEEQIYQGMDYQKKK